MGVATRRFRRWFLQRRIISPSTPCTATMAAQVDMIASVGLGGSRRLGRYPASFSEGSLAADVIGTTETFERHRHRHEGNNTYRDQITDAGLVFSGTSPDGTLVEFVEPCVTILRKHPDSTIAIEKDGVSFLVDPGSFLSPAPDVIRAAPGSSLLTSTRTRLTLPFSPPSSMLSRPPRFGLPTTQLPDRGQQIRVVRRRARRGYRRQGRGGGMACYRTKSSECADGESRVPGTG